MAKKKNRVSAQPAVSNSVNPVPEVQKNEPVVTNDVPKGEENVPKEKSCGVLLIALGHQQYGRMAFNLLVSIRAADPDMPVALVHNDTSLSHLTQRQREMFSQLIRCPDELYNHNGGRAYVKPKCWAYDLSPFDKTLFLDADMVLMAGKRISTLMAELSGKDFTIKNTGSYDIETKQHAGNPQYGYGGWETARLHDLASMYDVTAGHFTQLQGEVFYFEKSDVTARVFQYAQQAWTDQRAFLVGGFGGQNMNDELAFIIALAREGICAHSSPWVPSYWYLLEGGPSRLNRTSALNDFWLLSAGGHNVPEPIISFYNDLVGKAHYQMNLRPLFPLKRKIDYLVERKQF